MTYTADFSGESLDEHWTLNTGNSYFYNPGWWSNGGDVGSQAVYDSTNSRIVLMPAGDQWGVGTATLSGFDLSSGYTLEFDVKCAADGWEAIWVTLAGGNGTYNNFKYVAGTLYYSKEIDGQENDTTIASGIGTLDGHVIVVITTTTLKITYNDQTLYDDVFDGVLQNGIVFIGGAGGPNPSETEIKNVNLTYEPIVGPVPSIAVNNNTSYPTVELNFTGTASESVDSWLWDFGDGNTSTNQNPTHAYTAEGYYNVSLTTTNTNGTNTVTKKKLVRIYPTPAILFSENFSGDLSKWSDIPSGWSIADGCLSTSVAGEAKATIPDSNAFICSFKLNASSYGTRRIRFYNADESQYNSLWINVDGGPITVIQIIKTGENTTQWITNDYTLGTDITIGLIKDGAVWTVLYNENVVYTTSNWIDFTASKVAFQNEGDSPTKFDDLVIKTIGYVGDIHTPCIVDLPTPEMNCEAEPFDAHASIYKLEDAKRSSFGGNVLTIIGGYADAVGEDIDKIHPVTDGVWLHPDALYGDSFGLAINQYAARFGKVSFDVSWEGKTQIFVGNLGDTSTGQDCETCPFYTIYNATGVTFYYDTELKGYKMGLASATYADHDADHMYEDQAIIPYVSFPVPFYGNSHHIEIIRDTSGFDNVVPESPAYANITGLRIDGVVVYKAGESYDTLPGFPARNPKDPLDGCRYYMITAKQLGQDTGGTITNFVVEDYESTPYGSAVVDLPSAHMHFEATPTTQWNRMVCPITQENGENYNWPFIPNSATESLYAFPNDYSTNYMISDVAYGTWELPFNWLYNNPSTLTWNFIGGNTIGTTGYSVVVTQSDSKIKLIKNPGTVLIEKTWTGLTETDHLIKVERSLAGGFTLFLDDIVLGKIIDNTYTTSSKIWIHLDSGAESANYCTIPYITVAELGWFNYPFMDTAVAEATAMPLQVIAVKDMANYRSYDATDGTLNDFTIDDGSIEVENNMVKFVSSNVYSVLHIPDATLYKEWRLKFQFPTLQHHQQLLEFKINGIVTGSWYQQSLVVVIDDGGELYMQDVPDGNYWGYSDGWTPNTDINELKVVLEPGDITDVYKVYLNDVLITSISNVIKVTETEGMALRYYSTRYPANIDYMYVESIMVPSKMLKLPSAEFSALPATVDVGAPAPKVVRLFTAMLRAYANPLGKLTNRVYLESAENTLSANLITVKTDALVKLKTARATSKARKVKAGGTNSNGCNVTLDTASAVYSAILPVKYRPIKPRINPFINPYLY